MRSIFVMEICDGNGIYVCDGNGIYVYDGNEEKICFSAATGWKYVKKT